MPKQRELESSPVSSAFSSPLSSPPDSLDGFDNFETYESRRGIPPSPTPKGNGRRRPMVAQKVEAQEEMEKSEELDRSTGIEHQKTPSIPTPTRELAPGSTSLEPPKVVEVEEDKVVEVEEDKVDGVDHDVSEPHNTTSKPTSATEYGVQNPAILEQLGAIEKEVKVDGLGGFNGPEMISPRPPSAPESRNGPTMLEQPEALGLDGVAREPIKTEATGPATNQGPVDEIHETIIYGRLAPQSPSPPADDKIATASPPHENGTQSPTKRKAPGQGPKQSATKNARRSAPGPPRKTAKQKKWDPPFVISDPKSPLTEADLRAILLLPQAWDILSPDEKRSVLAKFPDEDHILSPGTDDARPDIQSLRNNDNFRHDCARYSENISEGRHDEEWLQQAWVAHEKHRRGDFDDYLEQKFVEDWSTEIPEEYRVRRARQSIDSAASGSRRVSTATSVVSRGSVSRAGSPVTKTTPENVRTLQKLTLENSPLPSEGGSPRDLSPTVGTSMEGVILSPSREM